MTVTGLREGLVDCPEGGDQHDLIFRVLREPFTVAIEGPTLQIQHPAGEPGLGYRAD